MEPLVSFSGLASGIQWRDMVDQIMQLESSRRLKPVTDQVSLQQKRKTAWGDFSNLATKLRDAATAFKDGSAFGAFTTSASKGASGRELVSASATATAAPGTYRVEVLELARAEKLGGKAFTSASDPLNLAGTFSINDQSITLDGTESLSVVRDRINAVSGASGVGATILSSGTGSHRLVLTATETGAAGIDLAETSGSVLQGLGVLSNESAVATSSSKSLELALGIDPPPAVTTVKVNGTEVTVDFQNDTLISLQQKFTSAGASVSIKEEVENGRTLYRLVSDTAPTVSADPGSQDVLDHLGFGVGKAGATITAGADARVRIDGFEITSSKNSISDAIEGVTLDLLASDAASRAATATGTGLAVEHAPTTIPTGSYDVRFADDGTGTTIAVVGGQAADWDAATGTIRGREGTDFEGLELTYDGPVANGASIGQLSVTGDISVDLTIARDQAATTGKVQAFVDAYNKVAGFLKSQNNNKGPLGSDGSLRSMTGSLRDVMFQEVDGLDPANAFTRLSLVGVEFTRDGTLKLDSSKLESALSTNRVDVEALFAGFGEMMETQANTLVDQYTGVIKQRTDGLDVSVGALKDRVESIEAQLERRREMLVQQFTAMEVSMGKIQSQGSWLSSQVSSLPTWS